MLTYFFPLATLLLLSAFLPSTSFWITSTIALLLLALVSLSSTPLSWLHLGTFFHLSDQLSSTLITLSLWIRALIIIARQKILIESRNRQVFCFTVIILAFILVIAFRSSSILIFYIFFEASLIPTLLLVLGWGYQPERIQASMYLILYTVTASLPLLISLTTIFKASGHLRILLPYWNIFPSHQITLIWWLISILAFLVKTPIYLTHLWLPKAHVEAPVAGSIILAGLLLKLGSYGLLRLASKFFLLRKLSSPLVIRVCLIGGVITRFICIRQTDVKALIAYSSVAHIGLATAGIISNTTWGWQGAFIILISHGLCSSCIFALANITYETVGSRGIYLTKGMLSLFPSITFWWFCFSACNIAAPPSINLAGEIILISSSISTSIFNSIPLALIAFIAAAYSLYLYTSTQHGSSTLFQNPLSLFLARNYSTCILHFAPLILFIINLDFISSWL